MMLPKWTTKWAPVLLIVSLSAPGADACHLGLGLGAAQGIVTEPEGITPAQLSLFNCEGAGRVTITRNTPDGPVRDTIDATLNIVAPKDSCLVGSCGFGSPAIAFTVKGQGLDLQGILVNGAHYAIAYDISGDYRGGPAAFTAAAS